MSDASRDLDREIFEAVVCYSEADAEYLAAVAGQTAGEELNQARELLRVEITRLTAARDVLDAEIIARRTDAGIKRHQAARREKYRELLQYQAVGEGGPSE